ncbi:alpha/beta hydrolase-fold protein [Pseudooceanicola sp. 200-1SW]|uniref:alpha/beta hydrolase-fold protein n=1 Tax=Pseudooceanicola sp. 200-1SW TaxID=3425949 RepID=UPI003D7FB188
MRRLDRVTEFDLPSPGGGLRVVVCRPAAAPPPGGYGVIYAMDAGWSFGTLCDLEARAEGGPAQGARVPAVIVGLGWPSQALIDCDRRGADLVGAQAAATLALLTGPLRARIEAALPVDPARRMILGHSFGGAFALQARAAHPALFSHVAAGSPSIWTDPEGLFAAAPRPGGRVLITLGAQEEPEAAAAAGAPPDRVARLRDRDMAGRARRMAAEMGARFVTLDGVGHGGAIPGFLAAAHAFLND